MEALSLDNLAFGKKRNAIP